MNRFFNIYTIFYLFYTLISYIFLCLLFIIINVIFNILINYTNILNLESNLIKKLKIKYKIGGNMKNVDKNNILDIIIIGGGPARDYCCNLWEKKWT